MKNPRLIVVYGSYGYTGKLIVNLCRQKSLEVVLAGRNMAALAEQSRESGYPYQVIESHDREGLRKLLEPAAVVIHCGGPFKHTAKTMAEACLATKTHYTDITGEYQVFEMLAGMDTLAMSATDGRTSLRLTGPGGREETVQLAPRYVADDLLTLKYAALAGTGLCWLPDYMCQHELQQGRLVQLLPEWSQPPGIVHAVFASRRGLSPAVRGFLDFLGETARGAKGDAPQ